MSDVIRHAGRDERGALRVPGDFPGDRWEDVFSDEEPEGVIPVGNDPGRVTMADLTDGTRVRHVEWQETGTIRACGGVTEIRWDDVFGDYEISDEGPVFPCDVEIIGRAS